MEIDRPNVNDRDNQNAQDKGLTSSARVVIELTPVIVRFVPNLCDPEVFEEVSSFQDFSAAAALCVDNPIALESPAAPEDW